MTNDSTMSEARGAVPCPAAHCPLCGQPNRCTLAEAGTVAGNPAAQPCHAATSGDAAQDAPLKCWCRLVEMPRALLARVPSGSRACVCHACVARERRAMTWMPLARSGEFYLLDDGRRVFTERYHLRRGYCCGSGCRHCPYDADGHPREDVVRAMEATAT